MKKENQKIKVAIIINDFLVGGAQRQLTQVLPHFDRDKFEFSLITLFQFESKSTLYESLPSWLSVHKLFFKGFLDLRSWYHLLKLLRSVKPSIVVSSLFFANTVSRVIKPLIGYVSIAREHNTYYDKTKIQIFIDWLLSFLSYKIVSVSTTVAEFTSHQEHIRRDKFVVIHNGIDLEDLNDSLASFLPKQKIKEKLGFLATDKLIINVARLAPQKNQKILIDAFAEFALKHNDYKLVILGDGDLRNELFSQAKNLGIENMVMILGNKKNVLEYYGVSEFFISTSYMEGMSNSCLEAMACGLPIVSTKTAGTDELLEDGKNGFFVKDDIADIIRVLEMMAVSDLYKMGQLSKEKVAFFDINKTAQRYENLLSEAGDL